MRPLKNFGIMTRLAFLTLVPIALMCFLFIVYSYYSRAAEERQDFNDRGALIASSIAKNSEYAVLSGNLDDLNRTISGIFLMDKSISKIIVLDAKKKAIINIALDSQLENNDQQYTAQIKREILSFNEFGSKDLPHISSEATISSSLPTTNSIGSVQVNLSPRIMIEKQHHRIMGEIVIGVVTLLICGSIGLLLMRSLTRPLTNIINALQEMRSGKYGISLAVTDGGELGELQLTVIDMAKSLYIFRNEMEEKVASRTRQLQMAHDAAIKSDSDKRKLIQNANTAIEEERKSIAIDIHDHLNASLIVIRLEAQRILAITSKSCPCYIATGIDEKAHSIIRNTASLYNMARGIVKRLRPEVIDTLGLRDAVEEMVTFYDENHPECSFKFAATGTFDDIDSNLAITAYRLIQETLSNVVKHAAASTCLVVIRLEGDHFLHIQVSDNGNGFDPDKIEPGIGLLGMRERVFGVQGKMEIQSMTQAGTKVIIALPVSTNSHPPDIWNEK